VTDRPAIQPTRVYSREEAAEVLGVSLSTVKRLIAEGHLKPAPLPGMRRVVITGSSLLRMLGEEMTLDSQIAHSQPVTAFGRNGSHPRNGGATG